MLSSPLFTCVITFIARLGAPLTYCANPALVCTKMQYFTFIGINSICHSSAHWAVDLYLVLILDNHHPVPNFNVISKSYWPCHPHSCYLHNNAALSVAHHLLQAKTALYQLPLFPTFNTVQDSTTPWYLTFQPCLSCSIWSKTLLKSM